MLLFSLPESPLAYSADRLRSVLLHGLSILFVYAVVREAFFRAASLPIEAYESVSILLWGFRNPKFLIVVVLPTLVLAWRHRSLRWSDLEPLPQLRWFLVVVCGVISWAYAAMDYNLYFDRGHELDRLLLVALTALIAFRPLFVWPFMGLAIAFVSQLHHGIPGFNWLDKVIVFESTLLFCAMLALQVIRRQDWLMYPVLTAGLLAADYVIPAVAKLRIDWMEANDLFDLTVSTYLNGWLSFIPQETMLRLIAFADGMNVPLKLGTLIIEFGALFLLANRRVFYLVALSTVALHLGIFVTSGIFFWKWILLNLALVVTVWRVSPNVIDRMFGWRTVVLTVILVATSPWHIGPSWLAWYDTPLSTYFQMTVVGESGREYNLRRDWMAPYDLIFSQDRFHYLVDEPFLTRTFGAIPAGRERYDELRDLRTREDVEALRQSKGWSVYHAETAAQFDHFIRLYFSTLNEGQRKFGLVPWPRPPYHIWNFASDPVYDGQEPVTALRVRLLRRLYTEGRIVEIEEKQVREIAIPATRAEALAAETVAPSAAGR